MWLFTANGFVSAVAHRDKPGMLLVRARRRDDLLGIAEHAGAEIIETPRADYRWRCEVPREAFAEFCRRQAMAIDYDNFKDACHGEPARDRALMQVWSAMHAIQR